MIEGEFEEVEEICTLINDQHWLLGGRVTDNAVTVTPGNTCQISSSWYLWLSSPLFICAFNGKLTLPKLSQIQRRKHIVLIFTHGYESECISDTVLIRMVSTVGVCPDCIK